MAKNISEADRYELLCEIIDYNKEVLDIAELLLALSEFGDESAIRDEMRATVSKLQKLVKKKTKFVEKKI